MGMKPARKKADAEAERVAKAAEQAAKARARESRERVRAVATGREPSAPAVRLPMPVSTITQERALCYTDPVGFDRYTPERFVSDCSPESQAMLTKTWKRGEQLAARRVPVDALPCVVIMASYLRTYDVELVDDFDALLDRYSDNVADCCHPDKFFASCIKILHLRLLSPSPEAFESIRIHEIYEAMF